MKIRHRQQFLGANFQPLIAGIGLALGAMPIATRVERDGSMTALRTGIDVAAQRCRTAMLNSAQHLEMLPSQPATALLNEISTDCAKDFSHLERWPFHLFNRFLGGFASSGLQRSSASSGLATACK